MQALYYNNLINGVQSIQDEFYSAFLGGWSHPIPSLDWRHALLQTLSLEEYPDLVQIVFPEAGRSNVYSQSYYDWRVRAAKQCTNTVHCYPQEVNFKDIYIDLTGVVGYKNLMIFVPQGCAARNFVEHTYAYHIRENSIVLGNSFQDVCEYIKHGIYKWAAIAGGNR